MCFYIVQLLMGNSSYPSLEMQFIYALVFQLVDSLLLKIFQLKRDKM
jgi:hypothetical protein